ncbi:MAG TPA: energy transducer TonB [Vicinamibacterales bacterium]|nr:energy transducer TonB [Vicinamibacterales bacterium]
MPRTMFQAVVSSRTESNSKWYTVPLSCLVHTTVLAVIIAVPLIATDLTLPDLRSQMEQYVTPYVPVVPQAPAVRHTAPQQYTQTPPNVPVVAPDVLRVETGLVPQVNHVEISGIESVASGFGVTPGVVNGEAPPAVTVSVTDPVQVGGHIKPPVRTRYVMPEYPPIARASRVQGVVILEAIIGADGRVTSARVLRSNPLLEHAALDAVKEWEYTLTLLNGRATPVIMTVTVRFTLK